MICKDSAIIYSDSSLPNLAGINFYEIQKHIIKENKEKTGIFLGTGVGKTLTTLVLAQGNILVICPKQQMLDRTWEKNNEKFSLGKKLTVINYDMFWREVDKFKEYNTVILDECHRGLGVTPDTRQRKGIQIPKTSKTFEAIFDYVQRYNPKRLYFASATPIAKPMNLWGLAKLFGIDWDFFKFRETFYIRSMIGRRTIWIPRKDKATLDRLAQKIKDFGYTGALKDFADVPEQTHTYVNIELTKEQKQALKQVQAEEADPLVRRAKERTIENGILYGKEIQNISGKEDKMVKSTEVFPSKKIDYILERAIEFDKLLIFAMYSGQIEQISKALKKEGHTVFEVTGQTKDRATVFQRAEALDKCIVVAQAGIAEGYRIPSIPCTIYASKSNRYVHYEQSLGRTIDMEHLAKKLYIHLIIRGGSDEKCHENIMSGTDFAEKLSAS